MDKNGNNNCLESFECPQCKYHEMLHIWVVTKMEMFDEGSGDHEDLDYDHNSYAQCPNCGNGGPPSDFEITEDLPG